MRTNRDVGGLRFEVSVEEVVGRRAAEIYPTPVRPRMLLALWCGLAGTVGVLVLVVVLAARA